MGSQSTFAPGGGKTRLIGSAAMLPVGLLVALLLLALAAAVAVGLGAAEIDLGTVSRALVAYDSGQIEQVIIRTVRLPRVVAGLLVGAGLAAAGAIMQGVTGNPLASPGLLGINAGAAFAVVVGVYVLGAPPLPVYGLLAMIGATVAGVLVYALASLGRGGASPAKLTLAGVIFSLFVSALTTALLVLDQNTFDQIRFWTVGSLAGRDWGMVLWLGPFVVAGLALGLLLGRQITTLSLGADVARGLGQQVGRTRALSAAAVILMVGGAVAIAGPVGFVGLVVPHAVRVLVGYDYRWITPYSAVGGALLVTVADTAGRVVQRPQEVPIGVMLALVGAPFFIYLVRRIR